MRLLLDEHYSPEIARQLRERGHDAVVAGDVGLLGREDEELLEWATAERRVLLSNNARHLTPLATEWAGEERDHMGILLTSDESMPRGVHGVGVYLKTLEAWFRDHPADDALRNQVRWVTPRE